MDETLAGEAAVKISKQKKQQQMCIDIDFSVNTDEVQEEKMCNLNLDSQRRSAYTQRRRRCISDKGNAIRKNRKEGRNLSN